MRRLLWLTSTSGERLAIALPEDTPVVVAKTPKGTSSIQFGIGQWSLEVKESPERIIDMISGREEPALQPPPECVGSLITKAKKDWLLLPQWFRDAYEAGHVAFSANTLCVTTETGPVVARRDDWITVNGNGALLLAKQDHFEELKIVEIA